MYHAVMIKYLYKSTERIFTAKIFQLKASWDRFAAAHPKFPLFLRAVSDGNVMQEGTIAEITITTADGRKYETNLKLTANDLQLFDDVRQIVK